MTLFEPVLAQLNKAGVRYVVVGGVAMVLHGHARLTADLDLALDLTPGHPAQGIQALLEMGLVPLLPVDPFDFADAAKRRQWVEERNLKVFTLYDPADPLRQVDVFAENPIPFEELWQRAVEVDLGTTSFRIASIGDLVLMKRAAGRTQDLADIEALEMLRDREPE